MTSISNWRVRIIVTGGQTGVDMGALLAARDLCLQTAGWCPPDGLNEAGHIEDHWGLERTLRDRSVRARNVPRSERTERCILMADAMLILRCEPLSDPGSLFARRLAAQENKPMQEVDLGDPEALQRARAWLARTRPVLLGIGGPAESTQPGIQAKTRSFLSMVLAP